MLPRLSGSDLHAPAVETMRSSAFLLNIQDSILRQRCFLKQFAVIIHR